MSRAITDEKRNEIIRLVKGWTAEKVSVDGRETYRITACPLYADERSER